MTITHAEVRLAPSSLEDIMLWPDESWCYRCEMGGMGFMGDDYEVIRVGEQRWHDILSLDLVC